MKEVVEVRREISLPERRIRQSSSSLEHFGSEEYPSKSKIVITDFYGLRENNFV